MLALSIAPGVAVIPAGWAVTTAQARAAAAVATLLVGLAVLLSRRRTIWQTTLVSAWWWALAALCAWCGIGLVGVLAETTPLNAQPLRLASATLSLCPLMALLGAKRPQHVAWNFVVFSLWVVILLPAAETYFLNRGHQVEVGKIRGWFLWILILLGPLNFWPTRYWLPSLLLAGGQVVALAPFMPLLRASLSSLPEVVGSLLLAAAFGLSWLKSRRIDAIANTDSRLWLDFRDTFGLFWALRVQERINATARQQGLDIALAWAGFCTVGGEPLGEFSPAIRASVRTAMKGLLRRFVSNRWIAGRLAAD